jgi:hypothetical protein
MFHHRSSRDGWTPALSAASGLTGRAQQQPALIDLVLLAQRGMAKSVRLDLLDLFMWVRDYLLRRVSQSANDVLHFALKLISFAFAFELAVAG